jgi:phytoene dehydrogenase-like protein
VGGCGAVTDALAKVIESNGGKMHTKSCVDKIILENNNAKGISAGGKKKEADIVISNLGHIETSKMYECKDIGYLGKISKLKPSQGIKISLSSDEPLINHSGVVFTPFTERINGINEVTNADPGLAPRGKHLVMSHQTMLSGDLNREINLGLLDLKKLFPNKKYKVLLVQCYSNSWPVNRAASGSDIGSSTPVSNLYIVGDGAKGKGGIEVEGIALGVRNVMREMGIN